MVFRIIPAITIVLCVIGVRPSHAQTQNVIVGPVMAACSAPQPSNPGALSVTEATSLIVAATTAKAADPHAHYVLHVIRVNANGVEQDGWYAFHNNRLDRERLFGASHVTLVVALLGGDQLNGSPLTYTVAITKKRPAPLQNLLDLAGFALQGAPTNKVAAQPFVCGSAVIDVNLLPSDMKFTASTISSGDQKELSTMTFDNERTYAVDVSFALPLTSHDDLSFDVDDGVATAKKVEKTDLFAVVNIGWPRDTKRMRFAWPTLLYGMPITGKPLKKQLVAVGFGYSKVQFFAGRLFTKREVASATTTDDLVTLDVKADDAKKWDNKWVWGVNLSVKFITDLLKGKS
jgi:hypothetical protein